METKLKWLRSSTYTITVTQVSCNCVHLLINPFHFTFCRSIPYSSPVVRDAPVSFLWNGRSTAASNKFSTDSVSIPERILTLSLLGGFSCQSSRSRVLFCCNLSLSSRVSYFSAVIFLKGISCHSFAFTGTFLPAAAWPLLGSLSSQSVPSCCSRIVYML